MKLSLEIEGQSYSADLNKPIDISLPLIAGEGQLSAWYVDPIRITPVRGDGFVGSVAEGGSVNFRDIFFNPHGHGTHTECVGHIASELHSINQTLKKFHFSAQLISVEADEVSASDDKTDLVINQSAFDGKIEKGVEAIVIRTLPNAQDKKKRAWSSTNPPFLSAEAMEYIYAAGVKHLLIDLPSVDKEEDGGALKAHHIFWNFPAEENNLRTITEFIFVEDEVKDGLYLLNLQIASFENDASPSKPVLYRLEK